MKSCLIVDDSRVIRKVAARILEELQFHTEEAEDGASALSVCRHSMPDVILLDWSMPNMPCQEFLRSVRKEKDGKRPKIVLCTTENDANHIADVLGAGADEYIMKPFDKASLSAKLAEIGAR
ncbi:MAG TPA: response regulator [Rhizomicrobium sp.]|jgi:two-component system chemotaxis response regulator CheY|nr:response regulator [Rhizomicrobium sp.]